VPLDVRLARGGAAAAAAAITAAGAISVVIAQRSPGFSFAGSSVADESLEGLVGLCLLAAGAAVAHGHPRERLGLLLGATAFAWFVIEWNNPGTGSASVFAVGLVFASCAPAVVTHAALHNPTAPGRAERVVITTGYLVTVGLGGILPAIFFDPAQAGCTCPPNPLLVHADVDAAASMSRLATYAGLAWLVVAILAVGARAGGGNGFRWRPHAPFHIVASAYLVVVGVDYVHSLRRGFLSNDVVDRRLWVIQACALLALAASTRWPSIRASLTRAAVARLVVMTRDVPAPGELATALGRALGDDTVRILYPLADGRMVDGSGETAVVETQRAITRLVQGDVIVALLEHREGILEPDLADRVVEIARLAVVHERLHAERRAQLADLRLSRARIVASADAERLRLERDLHDGAQQRLVSLALCVQLASLRMPDSADPSTRNRYDRAGQTLRTAMAELRRTARGLYPRELADEGLAAALDVLADSCPRPIQVHHVPDERLPAAVEAAAYFAVARLVGDSGDDVISVAASLRDDAVRLEIYVRRLPPDLVDIRDRASALAGNVTTAPAEGNATRVLLELPCG
jgi:signal transduction histidine kinase